MTKEKETKKAIEKLQDYSKNIQETFRKLTPKFPNIKIPDFQIPKIEEIESPTVIKERNNWERHSEIMGIQDAVLKIQENILNEQKSTSKMTLAILIITIIAIIISVLTFLKMIGLI